MRGSICNSGAGRPHSYKYRPSQRKTRETGRGESLHPLLVTLEVLVVAINFIKFDRQVRIHFAQNAWFDNIRAAYYQPTLLPIGQIQSKFS